jgi:hypothetical protein
LVVVPLLLFVKRRAWSRARQLTVGRRVAWIAGLLLLQVALLLCAVLVDVSTRENWIFSAPRPMGSLVSPDGRRTAYLTLDCFLGCNLEIHVREGFSPVMRQTVLIHDVAREPPPRMVWSADSQTVEALDVVHVPPVNLGFAPH